MSSQQHDYLSRLPTEAQYKGDYTKGEIEIATDSQTIDSIISKRLRRIKSFSLPSNAAKIGIVFEDEYIIVVGDPVIFPSGVCGTYLRIFERSGLDGPVGVVILPVRDGEIYLRKVFRHATRRWEIECPRGFRPKGRSPSEAVEQEIAEELGIKIKSKLEIGHICANTGLFAGIALAYWVTLQAGEPSPQPEEGEAFGEILALTPQQVMEKIRAGELGDGLTLSALQLAQAHKLFKLEKD